MKYYNMSSRFNGAAKITRYKKKNGILYKSVDGNINILDSQCTKLLPENVFL